MNQKQNEATADIISQEIKREFCRAMVLFPQSMKSYHEGYAVLLEETEELWDEIKFGKKEASQLVGLQYESEEEAVNQWKLRMKKEAIQVAAMAMRFVAEINTMNS